MKPFLLAATLSLFCLPSCLEDKVDTISMEEYEYLEEDIKEVKDELKDAHQELDAFDDKLADYEQLEKKAGTVDAMQQQLQEAEEAKKETEEQMRKLREEYEDYQKKYEAKVRTEAIGEAVASIVVGGRTLEGVEISSVTETEIKVSHTGGFATLNHETAPADWKERFFLRSEEEVEQRAAALASFLNPDPIEEVVTTGRPKRKPSVYQLKREELERQKEALTGLAERTQSAIVFISGKEEEGNGFFVQDGIATYLYTSPDVLDGNTELKITDASGKEWQSFGKLEVAVGRNLVRLEVTEEVEHILKIGDGSGLESGESLSSLKMERNASPKRETGRLREVSKESFEISTNVLAVSLGGPVMTAEGGSLALVTKERPTRMSVWKTKNLVREKRVAVRIDGEIEWQSTPLSSFIATATQVENFDEGTRLLLAFASLSPNAQGVQMGNVGRVSVGDVFEQHKGVSAVRQMLAYNEELSGKKSRISEKDVNRRFRSFFQSVAASAAKQKLDVNRFSTYHQALAKESLKYRAEANEEMKKSLERLKG